MVYVFYHDVYNSPLFFFIHVNILKPLQSHAWPPHGNQSNPTSWSLQLMILIIKIVLPFMQALGQSSK